MYVKKLFFIFFGVLLISCKESIKEEIVQVSDLNKIICTDESCYGTYSGPEFVNGSDIAHQFSNKMSAAVGDNLKRLYDLKKYSKVDFAKIEMTTQGMGSGKVEYKLIVPMMSVEEKCLAYTSFDHVGGWNHIPELQNRIDQLKPVLIHGEKLNISDLKRTNEGLQEYWIQWKNKDKQKDCG